MSRNDGGQAYPVPLAAGTMGDILHGYEGMTMRQYYAAHAPVTLDDALLFARHACLSVGMLDDVSRGGVFRALAILRLEYADMMIAEGEK